MICFFKRILPFSSNPLYLYNNKLIHQLPMWCEVKNLRLITSLFKNFILQLYYLMPHFHFLNCLCSYHCYGALI